MKATCVLTPMQGGVYIGKVMGSARFGGDGSPPQSGSGAQSVV